MARNGKQSSWRKSCQPIMPVFAVHYLNLLGEFLLNCYIPPLQNYYMPFNKVIQLEDMSRTSIKYGSHHNRFTVD